MVLNDRERRLPADVKLVLVTNPARFEALCSRTTQLTQPGSRSSASSQARSFCHPREHTSAG
jgi:hypothetical protein